jgi:signal transduction histidine kinase
VLDVNTAVGAPIVVDGRLWGVMSAALSDPPLSDLDERLQEFTELVATAIANSQARADLEYLAEEQAALRRVATLVAEGAPPSEVFEAVCTEVGRLIPADGSILARFELDGTVTRLGQWTVDEGYVPMVSLARVELGMGARLVLDTSRPARIPDFDTAPGRAVAESRAQGFRSAVVAPVVVDGRIWGVINVMTKSPDGLPRNTEARIAQFTDFAATAIANAESRAELARSRSRIVATADATRRRIERDLHDGAQQRLVSLALGLRAAQATMPSGLEDLDGELSRVVEGLTGVMDELREIAHGIHPAILAQGGLGPTLKAVARRSTVAVELEVDDVGELPEHVEVAAYFVVAEALANAAKHAEASVVRVEVSASEGPLRVLVRDDGRGGANPELGSGLLGLKDRAEALGGTMRLRSEVGGGTSVAVELPLDERADHPRSST